jgi:hypothetical protein
MAINIRWGKTTMINQLKEILKKNKVAFEEITDELVSIENFLTDEDLEFLFDQINSASQGDWEVEYLANLKSFCLEKFGRDDVENLVAEGKFEITQNWSDKNLNVSEHPEYRIFYKRLASLVTEADDTLMLSGLATIQRMQPGVELKSHTDQHTDPSIRYAAIIYINDDYENGELFFKNLGIRLRPKPKTLLIFPGNEQYEHGVDFVSEGPIRYVLVGFIKEKGFYERNKF